MTHAESLSAHAQRLQLALDRVDPRLDLVLDRTVPVPVASVWRAWTEPELLKQWFTPKPWKTTACAIDLRPGGLFRTVMEGPEGERNDSDGCYLVVEPERLLMFTDALGADYRPTGSSFMTACIYLLPVPEGCRYVALVRHGSAEACRQHDEMGFAQGWGTALDQLVALMST